MLQNDQKALQTRVFPFLTKVNSIPTKGKTVNFGSVVLEHLSVPEKGIQPL